MILRSIANSIMRNTKSLDEKKQRKTAKIRAFRTGTCRRL